MTSLDEVLAWKTQPVSDAATKIDTLSTELFTRLSALDTAIGKLSSGWEGRASTAAQGAVTKRREQGVALVKSLDAAHSALSTGARSISRAQAQIAAIVEQAHLQHFTVQKDGTVVPPTLPPVMTSPEDMPRVQKEQQRKAVELTASAQGFADRLSAEVKAAAAADSTMASALYGLTIPGGVVDHAAVTIQQLVDRIASGEVSLNVLGSLGGTAGDLGALGLAGKNLAGLAGKATSTIKFLQMVSNGDYATATFLANYVARNPGSAAVAKAEELTNLLVDLRRGMAGAGPLENATLMQKIGQNVLGRVPVIGEWLAGKAGPGPSLLENVVGKVGFLGGAGGMAAKVAGRIALPLTIYQGGKDALTGGGYDGARGGATRVMGAAGAAGALLLGAEAIAPASALVVAAGPVGLGVAGAAVAAYGAWQLGNYAWDHREQIAQGLDTAKDAVGSGLKKAGSFIGGLFH